MKNSRLNELALQLSRNDLLIPLDVLLVGGTGTGKSSTLNALFGSTVATVGDGVAPETQETSSHSLNDFLRFHDSAGLGDGKAADHKHSKNITSKLLQTCTVNEDNYRLIDVVLILLDGGSRDLGTAFKLIESIVLKSIEPQRVIIAINQADMAMKGRHWDHLLKQPEPTLIDFLEEKSQSIQHRIKETTGLTIKKPIYYSAVFNYNIDTLTDHIISHIQTSRRTIL